MFKRLRRRFTALNMLVISLLMLGAFSGVCTFAYSVVHQQVNTELTRLLDAQPDQIEFGEAQLPEPDQTNSDVPWEWDGTPPEAFPGQQRNLRTFSPKISFSVVYTGDTYTLEFGGSFLNEDNVNSLDIPAMLAQVQEEGGTNGSFRQGEYSWSYRTATLPNGTQKVAFVETSEIRNILLNLLEGFGIITAILLGVIWLVSRWFARRSIAPIEDAYNDQRRFVQDASHELKTPVAVMKTNLELLSSHPEATVASQEEWIDNMRTETVHMEKLTGLLLALARSEADAPQAAHEEFSLSDAVEGSVLPLEAVLYEKGLHFTSEIAADIRMNGNRDEVERLVHILVENAIQYTPPEGQIALTLEKNKHKALLRVTNTGAGIAPEDLPHIFKRFYRADKSRNSEDGGYGLGLAIAQNIARRGGGEIKAESTPGQETVFTVTLPAL